MGFEEDYRSLLFLKQLFLYAISCFHGIFDGSAI